MRSRQTPRQLIDSAGVAAVEFALVAPVLILLLVGTVDIGTAYWEKTEIDNAAWAGAVYAAVNGNNSSGISAAMSSATGLTSIQSAVGQRFYGCPTASGITAEPSASITCGPGGTARTYVTVTASVSYSPVLPYPGFSTLALTSNVAARVQ